MPEDPCTCTFYRPFKNAEEEAAWRKVHDLHIKTKNVFDELARNLARYATKQDLADVAERLERRIDSISTTVAEHTIPIAELKRPSDAH